MRGAVCGEGEARGVLLMYLGRSGVVGSVSAHILPARLRARQVLSGCGGGRGRRRVDNDC